jgi:predicted house-cleaning NTP pyrophosphatase (Maf/HAM1 superfamily)
MLPMPSRVPRPGCPLGTGATEHPSTPARSSGVGSERTGGRETVVVETAVEFVVLGDDLVEWYVGTGEPFGKAGGYALQGAGGALVRRIEGSVTNVIGLPLAETLDLIRCVAGSR